MNALLGHDFNIPSTAMDMARDEERLKAIQKEIHNVIFLCVNSRSRLAIESSRDKLAEFASLLANLSADHLDPLIADYAEALDKVGTSK